MSGYDSSSARGGRQPFRNDNTKGIAAQHRSVQDRAKGATGEKRREYLLLDARGHCSARLQHSAAELTGNTRIVLTMKGAAMLCARGLREIGSLFEALGLLGVFVIRAEQTDVQACSTSQ